MKRDRGQGETPGDRRKIGAGAKPTGVFKRIEDARRESGEKQIVRHTQAENLKS